MSLKIDLHAHSYYSDGSLSPGELIARAAGQGVNIIALTDHDETRGLVEARQQAESDGIHLVEGVEVSVTWGGKTVHVVGLGIDSQNSELMNGLQSIRDERVRRARKIAKKLENCGMDNVWQEITESVGFEAVTRTHFARYLVEKNQANDMQQAFKRYLARKGKAYVNGHWVTLEHAVQMINNAGGQAVIAHPVRYKMTNSRLEKMVAEFKQFGGAGIEVVASRYSLQEKAYVASIARRFDLLASVGSDFHSPGNPYIELGQNLTLPIETKAIWESWPVYLEMLDS